MPLEVNPDDVNTLRGKRIAELLVEQRVCHGAGQEHRDRAHRLAVPYR